MVEKKNVGIVGATGVVGKTIARVLEERAFPVGDFLPAATSVRLPTVQVCVESSRPRSPSA